MSASRPVSAPVSGHLSGRRVSVVYLPVQRAIVWATVGLYPVILVLTLKHVISPSFAYSGFDYIVPDNQLYGPLIWLMAVLPGLVLPIRGKEPSLVALWTLYLLVYVPAQVVPVYASGRTLSSYLPFQGCLLLGFFITLLLSSIRPVTVKTLWLRPSLYWGGVALFSALTYVVVFQSFGVPTRIPGLLDVYDVRGDFLDEAAGQSGMVMYLMGWQGKVVNPLLMAFGVAHRRPAMLSLGVLGQVLLYSLTGHKSVLFSTLLVAGILIVYGRGARAVGAAMTLGTVGVIVLAILMDAITGSVTWSSLFVRRLMLVPGLLTGYYHEFFVSNPKTLEFGPFFRPFTEYPYDLRVPFLIGSRYFGNPATGANANIWADGFASFGYWGVLGFSAILGMLLFLMNSFARNRDFRIAAVLAGVAVFNLVNSGLMTSISTHGLAVAIVLLLVYPRSSGADGRVPETPGRKA